MRIHSTAIVLLFVSLVGGAVVGCGHSSSDSGGGGSTAPTAAKPSTAMTAVASAVKTAGTSMGASGVAAASLGTEPVFHPRDISQDCSVHAQPLRAGVAVSQSDQDYPGKFMYCKLAYNTEDPESVQGAMTEVKSIACSVENAGVVWDGQAHSLTINIDSACWSATQLSHMGGGGGSMAVTVTASTPASFNTYYERGLIIDTGTGPTGVGIIEVAANVSATKIEFMSSEAEATHNKYDAFAGAIDYAGGEIRYELRGDRYNDTVDSNSGGFSRHQRIYAKVTTSGQNVTGLTSVSASQVETYNGAVQSGYGGQAITASGALATGIKARFWTATNGAGGAATGTNDLSNPSKWSETANTRCYSNSSANAGGCTAGIALPTTNGINSFPFALVGTGFTSGATWAAARGAWSFTTVDPGTDIQ